MDCVTPIINLIREALLAKVKTHLGYIFSSTESVENMSKKLSELNEAKRKMKEKEEDASINDRLIPDSLPGWFKQVEEITDQIQKKIPVSENGSFNPIIRYKAGWSSLDIIKKIDDLLKTQKDIEWSSKQRPLAKVISSTGPSTSKSVHDYGAVTQNIYPSRTSIFSDMLSSLEPENKTQMVAIWGMGGVGKSTMMEDIKKVVEKNRIFEYVLRLDIGRKFDPITTRKRIANHMDITLKEENVEDMVERLEKSYEKMSENGKKVLFILDDIWEEINLEDIGLTSPLPKGFKLLVTSRNEKVCIGMNIKSSSIFEMGRLQEAEAKDLFWKTSRYSDGDVELSTIGEDIIKKCGGLPIAIKTIASALRGERKDAWELTQKRLQRHNLKDIKGLENVVNHIFEISYNNLTKDDEKAIFVTCGLFPDDYDIALEELLRYGWGLQFFNEADNLAEARKQINTCVHNLIRANLLTESYTFGRVKMHDLARDFVLSNISKFKQASIVSDGDRWPTPDTQGSCEKILLTCKGMLSEFPQDFNYPNLTLLKLMNGDEQLKFPEEFHKRMEKLVVMAYDEMEHPLRTLSLSYSTSLRTLCLHSCSLVNNDISFLGDLINLEVLSLAHCGICNLPSTISKLKKLKLLDSTGCIDLFIHDGVLQNLIKLEELFMSISSRRWFKYVNIKELEMLLPKLYALEVDHVEDMVRWTNVSLKKLERFRISMGCYIQEQTDDRYILKNALWLTAKLNDLIECKITELFSRTEELYFSVEDIVEDISMSPTQHSIFSRLIVLQVSDCPKLTYLFTIHVANGLTQLESLKVSSCPALKSLVNLCDAGVDIMKLPQLVELNLSDLPSFTSIILDNDISTKQSLFSKEVVVPNLSKLAVDGLMELKRIWACDITSSEEDNVSMLRKIEVNGCESLVNLFPENPMRLLSHLEELKVNECKSIKYLFSPLVSKLLLSLKKLEIENCIGMEEVVSNRDDQLNDHNEAWTTSTTTLFPCLDYLILNSLDNLKHTDDGGVVKGKTNVDQLKFTQVGDVSWSLCQYSRDLVISGCETLSSVVPSYAAGQTQKLQNLEVGSCISIVEVFETKEIKVNNITDSSSNVDPGSDVALLISRTKIITRHQLPNLKSVSIFDCHLLKYTFTFSTLESLTKLEELRIRYCQAMKVIVRADTEEASSNKKVVKFPCLKSIHLLGLPNIEGFFMGMNVDFQFPSLYDVTIKECPQMTVFTSGKSTAPKLKYIHTGEGKLNVDGGIINLRQILPPSSDSTTVCPVGAQGTTSGSSHSLTEVYVLGDNESKTIVPSNDSVKLQNLETIFVEMCENVEEVFEEVTNNGPQTVVKFPKLREVELKNLDNLKYLWKSNRWSILEFPSLTKLYIDKCFSLEHVFTTSMVGSLLQLQELHIIDCCDMEVIVKKDEEECDGELEFPCLKSLKLVNLSSLNRFCFGNNNFSFPLMNTFKIIGCPEIRIFSEGCSIAPQLKVVETYFGSVDVVCEDINSFIMTKRQEGYKAGEFRVPS